MSERRPCIRCSRAIDAWAKSCPFCNWDQETPAPAVEPPKPAAVANYTPPSEYNLKKKAVMGVIGALTLVAAFGVGMVINSDGAPDEAPATVEEQLAEEAQRRNAAGPVRRAETPLVPTNEPGGIEQPVTSAPVVPAPGAAPDDYQRTDATAVSATEYAEIARRAKAEKDKMAALVDPRTLTGPAYAQSPRAVRVPARRTTSPAQNAQLPPQMQQPNGQMMPGAGAPPAASAPQPERPQRTASVRTRPVPQSQPLPTIYGKGKARLSLIIGPDGRVKEIDVQQGLDRHTAQLVSAVQQWRFKPATENGEPVSAPYSVEINFK